MQAGTVTSMAPVTQLEKATVVIVDDHPLVCEWLAALINQQPDLQTGGQAFDAAEAMELINDLKPQVVILDISLQGGSGINLIKDLKVAVPNTAVIVLSMHDESLYAERAFRAGARGYVMKREATQKILEAIRRVLSGKPFLSEKVALMMAEKLVEGRLGAPESRIELLSNRELEVFQLLGAGLTSRQIAEEMRISFRTAQSFCARIKVKLKLRDGTDLLREAVRWHDRQHLQ
jgi:DNA-binding NarL/FixJ family response regulator